MRRAEPARRAAFTVTVPLGTAHLPQTQVRAPDPGHDQVGAAAYVERLRWPFDAADRPAPLGRHGGRRVPRPSPAASAWSSRPTAARYAGVRPPAAAVRRTAVADLAGRADAARAAAHLVPSDAMMPLTARPAPRCGPTAHGRGSGPAVVGEWARALVEGAGGGGTHPDQAVRRENSRSRPAHLGLHGGCGGRRRRQRAAREVPHSAAHAPVGIFQTDARGHRLFVNERWCELAGRRRRRPGRVGQRPHRKTGAVFGRYAKWRAEFDGEYRFRTPRGEVSWVHALPPLSATPPGGGGVHRHGHRRHRAVGRPSAAGERAAVPRAAEQAPLSVSVDATGRTVRQSGVGGTVGRHPRPDRRLQRTQRLATRSEGRSAPRPAYPASRPRPPHPVRPEKP